MTRSRIEVGRLDRRRRRLAWLGDRRGLVAPAQFPHAWLAAVTGWIGWPLGSIALILIHALTGGRWGLGDTASACRGHGDVAAGAAGASCRSCLCCARCIRGCMPMWLPASTTASTLTRRSFMTRGIVYLIVWLGLGALVLRALRQKIPSRSCTGSRRPGLILLALTVTFAAFDYTLSMEPRFKSSVYGLLVGTEGVLLALSVAVMGVTLGGDRARARARRPKILGKLMLGLLVFWAYLDFMQLLIIWQSDLPHEADWYVRRTAGGWGIVAAVVAGLHFVLPFFALLWPQVQRSRRAMGWLAALLVAIEIPRAWWIVIPAAGRALSLLDVVAMLAVIGLAAGMALRVPRLVRLPDRTGYNG